MPRITIFNEFRHERHDQEVREIYPQGMHVTIGDALRRQYTADGGDDSALAIRHALLDDDEHGLGGDVLDNTDTLLWWGHMAHDEVSDETADRVQQAVLAGMGLVVLHSAHFSKPFRRLMGTNCSLYWRVADDSERLWNLQPGHPILAGVPESVELAREEMYGERFDIPEPDELLMISWFSGGEVFRSLCTWQRGHGKVVYFRPGHETYPTFHNEHVQRIISNASLWSARRTDSSTAAAPNRPVSPEELLRQS